jgi:DNA-binding NtrC family response regulator
MMTLIIEGATGSRLTYQLDKPIVSIGAASRNDVVLRAPGVAPKHLVIQRNQQVTTFLGQHQQVVVLNGERRSRGVLKVGDRIRIGAVTITYQGGSDAEADVEVVDTTRGEETDTESVSTKPITRSDRKPRSEIVLYRESHRLSEARQQLVEIFRARMRSDPVPSLRTFFSVIFTERQALLAVVDEEGSFQPVVSQWQGDLPRLPARTFDELASVGRYAILKLVGLRMLLYPVDRGSLRPNAYLLAETTPENEPDDRELVGELARMLSIHWDRIEQSPSLFGEWQSHVQRTLEGTYPGSSQAVRVLRDSVADAARSAAPVMICGRSGSGRTFLASLIASLRPAGPSPVHVFQAQADDDSRLRLELFGPAEDDDQGNLTDRTRGSVVVVRDVHLMSQGLQRELSAAISEDVESGYGPAVRWIVTTDEDAMTMLNEGRLDIALYRLFDRRVIRVPSLDERREDLPLIVVRLLERVGAEQGKQIRGIELETLNSLLEYSFDGEMTELLGELRRLVSAAADGEMVRGLVPRRASVGGGTTTGPMEVAATDLLIDDDLKNVIPAVERLIIDRVLRREKGNQSQSARILNLSRGALIAKIKEYDIPDYRSLRRAGRSD